MSKYVLGGGFILLSTMLSVCSLISSPDACAGGNQYVHRSRTDVLADAFDSGLWISEFGPSELRSENGMELLPDNAAPEIPNTKSGRSQRREKVTGGSARQSQHEDPVIERDAGMNRHGSRKPGNRKMKSELAVEGDTEQNDNETDRKNPSTGRQNPHHVIESVDLEEMELIRMAPVVAIRDLTDTESGGGGARSNTKNNSAIASDWERALTSAGGKGGAHRVEGPSLTTYLVAIAAVIVVGGAVLTPK